MADARLFVDGRIFTGRRYVEALLIDGGRVVAAGDRAAVGRDAPTGTERVSLDGHLLLPGLLDLHLHLSEVVRTRAGLSLDGVRSHRELMRRISDGARERTSPVLVGRGILPEGFPDRARVDRRDLDAIVPDRPVVLYHASGHTAVVNGAALEWLASRGISLPEPVERLPDGRESGVLYEEAVRILGPLVAGAFPVRSQELASLLREAASLGLTTVGAMNAHAEELTALGRARDTGELAIRVRGYVQLNASPLPHGTPATDAGAERFRIVGVKAFADGAFGPRTAALAEPYDDDPGEHGRLVGDDDAVIGRLTEAAERGLASAVHAIGDRAVLRAARWISRLPPLPGARHRIEHASLAPPETWPALTEVRPALVVQPGFLASDTWLRARLGPERARWAYPFRSLVDRGFLLASSSDAPYDPIDPWRGVRSAVQRRDELGRSANPAVDEALPPETAVALATVHAGEVLGEPDLGTLEPGSHADLLEVDGPDVSHAVLQGSPGVVATWCAGVEAYRRPGR